jgi:hypothetical protein
MKRKISLKILKLLPNTGGLFLLIAVILISGLVSFSGKDKFHKRFFEDFSRHSSRYFQANINGAGTDLRYEFGKESPTEPGTKIVSFRIDPEDPAGAGKGPEIVSKDFTHFGTYAARLKVPDVAKIQPNTGAVVGYFTYHMENGPGLSEIDFEWLVADPEIIYVGTWTGQHGDLRRIGRAVNMANGIIYNTEYREDKSGIRNPLTGMQSQPENIQAIEGYNASTQFYTYGFDWHPDRIRWWMIHPATADTVVLWNYSGSQTGIPQNRTRYRMNFWHTNNWPVETNPNSIEKPLHHYELEIDRMTYRPFKN